VPLRIANAETLEQECNPQRSSPNGSLNPEHR
jgi:hypothetical protein